MMMRAIGVGDPDRWVGQAWKIFAIYDGIRHGILTTDVNYEEEATREETAQYTLNGMTRGDVEKRTSTWFAVIATANADGRPTGIIGNEYHSVEAANQAALEEDEGAVNGINYTLVPFQKTVEVPIGSIASSIHGLSWETRSDYFGRPGQRVWIKGDATIAVAMTHEPIRTYSVPVTEATLFRDLRLTENVTDATRINNGVRSENATIRRNNSAAVTGSGRGAITEIYHVDNKYTIVIIDTWLGKVLKVEPGASATWDHVSIVPSTVKPNLNFIVGAIITSGFAADDVVLYTATSSDNGVTYTVRSMQHAKEDILTPASFAATNFRAGGRTYNYSKNYVRAVASTNQHIVWFDDFGYAIDVDAPPAIPNYAYVIRSVSFDSYQEDRPDPEKVHRAELLLKDGKIVVADLARAYEVDDEDTADPSRLVTYTVSGSRYTLTAASTPANLHSVAQNGIISVVLGSPRIAWQNRFNADISTVYMVRTGVEGSYSYTAYTGIREVPSLGGLGTPAVRGIVLHTDESLARVVYIENPMIGSGPDLVFISRRAAEQVTTADGSYWKTSHILFDGGTPPDEFRLAENYAAGLYRWMNTNEKGLTSLEDPADVQIENIGNRRGIITIYGGDFEGAFVPADDINVFLFNPDNGAIERSDVSALPSNEGGAERTFYITLGAGATAFQITNLFIQDTSIG